MALHLNLYHEIERQKLAKARDPLKLSMMGLGVVAAIFAGFYVWQLGVMRGIEHELIDKQRDFTRLEPQAKEALIRDGELAQVVKTSEMLSKSIEARFYWAPLLEQVSAIVPRDVQITRLAGTVEGTLEYKKCTLTISGIASGAVPRKTSEEFRSALSEEVKKRFESVTASFRTLEDSADTVVLEGLQKPTALFQIAMHFSSGTEPSATPAPTKRSKR
jgi:Tfp pilus assembly protein PilN